MVTALRGILLEVDPSINTVIVQIDEQEYGKYIIQQLDDEHILINKDKVKELKEKVQARLKGAIIIRNLDYISNTDSE